MHGSNPIFSNPKITPIPVIASFTPDGTILPLYARIQGESYKIYNCQIVDATIGDIHYQGEVMVGEYVKKLYLMYHFQAHAWFQTEKYVFTADALKAKKKLEN